MSELPDRRHPVHVAPAEKGNESIVVEVTVCTAGRAACLANTPLHRLLHRAWETALHWRTGDYIIMPDHVHLFCSPGEWPPPSLKRWVSFWKTNATRAIRGFGPLADPWREIVADPGGPRFTAAGGQGTVERAPPPERLGGPRSTAAESGDSEGVDLLRRQVVRAGDLWQRDFWDTQMRDRATYDEKLSYVRMNPVRAGLVPEPGDWAYRGRVFDIGF